MDALLRTQLSNNSLNYKRSLQQIIDKYSKLHYQDGGIEVDLGCTDARTLEHYMRMSKTELSKLQSKSLTDLREESLRAQDITRHSQLDVTQQDGGADDTCVSSVSSGVFGADDEGATSDSTQLTVSSLDETQRDLSVTELQPEDQDEELEMSLRSHGSSWVELYPSMISRIERAWHRQHVSEAADSVLRRYRRWRQQSNRSHLNNTFIVTLRHSKPKIRTSKTQFKEGADSPVKNQLAARAAPLSPLQMVTNLQDWQAQPQSPGKMRGLLSREQHQPILVMDFSDSSESRTTKESSLNETFTVCQLTPPKMSQLGERLSSYSVSPSRRCYPAAKASMDLSLRSRRLSLTEHSPKSDRCSMYASQSSTVKERPDIYGSPVRQSPLKPRTISSLSRSPHTFSREPIVPRQMSTSLSSSPQKPAVPQRMVYPQDPHLSPQLVSVVEGRHRLRRHLSFDSSVPSIRTCYSPKKLDEDFIKLYHKFVCQNKSSFFNGPPCRFCARSSEASRGHSSSALAALALSPHRSVLRKRHRELSWESHRQSKRLRDDHFTSSPGSKRHGAAMLRCLSAYEPSHDGLSHSPSKHSMLQRFRAPQRSPDAHQVTWMSRGHHVSADDFSSTGGSLNRRADGGCSPRKWW